MDHLERARREEEGPLLAQAYEQKLKDDEQLFHSEAGAFKAAHRAAWEADLAEKQRLIKVAEDRAAVAQQIQARRAEEFAALKVRGGWGAGGWAAASKRRAGVPVVPGAAGRLGSEATSQGHAWSNRGRRAPRCILQQLTAPCPARHASSLLPCRPPARAPWPSGARLAARSATSPAAASTCAAAGCRLRRSGGQRRRRPSASRRRSARRR